MKNKEIKKRVYYALDVTLASPLNVSSGQDLFSDSDVMRNGDSELFVPGTSLAGAFRNALKLAGDRPGIMGYACEQEGRMSGMFLSDLYFEETGGETEVSIRDGVKLADDKNVENKFDMEIIETGAKGTIFLNFIVREEGKKRSQAGENTDAEYEAGQEESVFERAVSEIILRLQSGVIRIGSNKTRGFGRLRIEKIYRKEFSEDNLEDYISFKKNFRETGRYDEIQDFDSWKKSKLEEAGELPGETEYITIEVPLKLNGGISIRRYSAQPEAPDFEHITCNGEPVIPGSSWNGAIQSGIRKILKELGYENYRALMEDWFGSIKKGSVTGISRASAVVFSESIICGAQKVPVTRNSINRFDASTKDGALYSEIAWFGGETTLEISVRKDESRRYKEFLSILRFVIQDIQEGYMSVGGQVSIGRGIFEKNGEVTVKGAGDSQYSSEALLETLEQQERRRQVTK